MTDTPATPRAKELDDVTVEFAASAEFSRYTGSVRLHASGWLEVPELRRLFPPDAIEQIQY